MSPFDCRNAIGMGLSGIVSLFGALGSDRTQNNLICENNDNLTQEDGSLILLD